MKMKALQNPDEKSNRDNLSSLLAFAYACGGHNQYPQVRFICISIPLMLITKYLKQFVSI